MEYIYGALLLHKLGKEVNEENMKSVVEATSTEVDETKVKAVIDSLKGGDIDKELDSASLITAAPAQDSSEDGKKEEKKEKPKEEKKEAAAEGLSALFG